MPAGGLARFQEVFARALLAPQEADTSCALAALPGFAVYRNTVMKGCIDALQANYPAVARLVGEEWFRAAAAVYARQNPPLAPMLFDYGAAFADFLAGFEPAVDLPYLPAVARLDRFWSESHVSPDELPLRADALAVFDPAQLGRKVLRPHAAARWAWFPLPAYAIWSRNRKPALPGCDEPEIEWRGEGALLVRPGDAVDWLELDEAGCLFLDACAAGKTLATAAESALAIAAATDLAALIARLLNAGAFALQTD